MAAHESFVINVNEVLCVKKKKQLIIINNGPLPPPYGRETIRGLGVTLYFRFCLFSTTTVPIFLLNFGKEVADRKIFMYCVTIYYTNKIFNI